MKKAYYFMTKSVSILLVMALVLSLCSCGIGDVKNTAGNIANTVSNATRKALSKTEQFLTDAKQSIISAYGTAKDGVVYVYDEAAALTTEAYDRANAKAQEVIGNVSEYIDGLKKTDTTVSIKYAQCDPNRPVKDLHEGKVFDETDAHIIDKNYIIEQFISFYVSSILSARGYEVYSGAVYYKDNIYGGLIFTKDDVFIDEDGKTINSCGFIQLISDDYKGIVITDRMVRSGLVAVSSGSYGTDVRPFIVEEYTVIDNFSGIYNNTYFSLEQESNFVLRVTIKENKKSNYNSKIELYDFDNEKYIYQEKSSDRDVEKLFIENNEAFQGASTTVNAIVDYEENSNEELATVFVMDGGLLDTLLSKAESGIDSIVKFIKSAVKGTKIKGSQFISIDEKGKAHILGSEKAVDEARLTNGVISTIGSGLATAGAVASVVCIVSGGTIVISAIVITTGTSAIVYNVSNMIAGVQEVYYGAKGSESESANPVLSLFKQLIPDEQTATLVYHIWGVSNTMISMLSMPATKALSIAKTKGLNTFQTTTSVIRASLTQIAKGLATGIGAGIVSNYVSKIVTKITNNENLGKLVGFGACLVAGFIIYKGLDSIDQKLDISGLYPKSSLQTAFSKVRENQRRILIKGDVASQNRGEVEESINSLVDIATEQYGLESRPTVKFVYDGDLSDCGSYNVYTDTLTINMRATDHLNMEGIIDTIGHEMEHALQWQEFFVDPNSEMAYSLTHYIPPQEGFQNYYEYCNQPCEKAAFEAGARFTEYIFSLAGI